MEGVLEVWGCALVVFAVVVWAVALGSFASWGVRRSRCALYGVMRRRRVDKGQREWDAWYGSAGGER